MSRQMADIEFQMDIAPRLNYKGPIDPSLARNRSQESTGRGDYGGFIGTGSGREVGGVIDDVRGSVNILDDDPSVWAHEYRHLQMPKIESLDDFRNEEMLNLRLDAYNAQNEKEFGNAVLDWWSNEGGSIGTAKQRLMAELMRMEENKTDMMNDNPYWKRMKKRPDG